MHETLSLQALNWLYQRELRLKRDGELLVKNNGKVAAQVINWCIAQQLLPEHYAQLPAVRFTSKLLNDIAHTQRQLKHASFRDNVSKQDRLTQAQHSTQELKSAGSTPRQVRVLLRLNQATIIQNLPLETIDIAWQQLNLANYDALLVVENLDCFYQLPYFALQLPYQHPLIIYRGDKLYSKGCKALKSAWFTLDKPALYFGDFDAKGVSIALHEGYSAMLLPEFTTLQQHSKQTMLPNKQLRFITGIATKRVTADFLPYQQLLCQQLTGLRQQNMQGMQLIAISCLA